MVFDGVEDDGGHGILHEITKEDKGKILLLEGLDFLFLWMQMMRR